MAKQPTTKPTAPPAPQAGAVTYPKNWGRMSHPERQAWMKEHIPSRNPNAPVANVQRAAPALGVAGDPPPADDQDAEIPPAEYPPDAPAGETGDIVIPASALGALTGHAFLAKLFRSMADALDGLAGGGADA